MKKKKLKRWFGVSSRCARYFMFCYRKVGARAELMPIVSFSLFPGVTENFLLKHT